MSTLMTKIMCISIFFFILIAVHFVTIAYPFIGLGLFLFIYTILCLSLFSEDKKEEKDITQCLDNEEEIKTLIRKLYLRLTIIRGDNNDN